MGRPISIPIPPPMSALSIPKPIVHPHKPVTFNPPPAFPSATGRTAASALPRPKATKLAKPRPVTSAFRPSVSHSPPSSHPRDTMDPVSYVHHVFGVPPHQPPTNNINYASLQAPPLPPAPQNRQSQQLEIPKCLTPALPGAWIPSPRLPAPPPPTASFTTSSSSGPAAAFFPSKQPPLLRTPFFTGPTSIPLPPPPPLTAYNQARPSRSVRGPREMMMIPMSHQLPRPPPLLNPHRNHNSKSISRDNVLPAGGKASIKESRAIRGDGDGSGSSQTGPGPGSKLRSRSRSSRQNDKQPPLKPEPKTQSKPKTVSAKAKHPATHYRAKPSAVASSSSVRGPRPMQASVRTAAKTRTKGPASTASNTASTSQPASQTRSRSDGVPRNTLKKPPPPRAEPAEPMQSLAGVGDLASGVVAPLPDLQVTEEEREKFCTVPEEVWRECCVMDTSIVNQGEAQSGGRHNAVEPPVIFLSAPCPETQLGVEVGKGTEPAMRPVNDTTWLFPSSSPRVPGEWPRDLDIGKSLNDEDDAPEGPLESREPPRIGEPEPTLPSPRFPGSYQGSPAAPVAPTSRLPVKVGLAATNDKAYSSVATRSNHHDTGHRASAPDILESTYASSSQGILLPELTRRSRLKSVPAVLPSRATLTSGMQRHLTRTREGMVNVLTLKGLFAATIESAPKPTPTRHSISSSSSSASSSGETSDAERDQHRDSITTNATSPPRSRSNSSDDINKNSGTSLDAHEPSLDKPLPHGVAAIAAKHPHWQPAVCSSSYSQQITGDGAERAHRQKPLPQIIAPVPEKLAADALPPILLNTLHSEPSSAAANLPRTTGKSEVVNNKEEEAECRVDRQAEGLDKAKATWEMLHELGLPARPLKVLDRHEARVRDLATTLAAGSLSSQTISTLMRTPSASSNSSSRDEVEDHSSTEVAHTNIVPPVPQPSTIQISSPPRSDSGSTNSSASNSDDTTGDDPFLRPGDLPIILRSPSSLVADSARMWEPPDFSSPIRSRLIARFKLSENGVRKKQGVNSRPIGGVGARQKLHPDVVLAVNTLRGYA
ncbi:hypothetical protein DL93DRAFT_773581 [Clavulina sp. PMI_390]|nr:hypothetical protein DL93DRAFT_773581 [Clavulina sp. PMI_390]